MDLKQEIFDHVVNGDAPGTRELTERAMKTGIPPDEILNEALIAAMAEVGARFERRDFFVPEMLVAARAMKVGADLLRPVLAGQGVKPLGTVLMGTVAGDLHDLGKNLVIMMLEGAGLRVIDLGIDQSPESFVQGIREHSPQIVGMSALLTTTMPAMKLTIEAIKEAGLRDEVIIMVGGAPVTQRYADQIGADLYAPDASAAGRRAKEALTKH